MTTTRTDALNREKEQSGLIKRMLDEQQIGDYRYDLGSGYHRLRKQNVTDRYEEKAAEGMSNPSYPFKIHLSLDILTNSASDETVCSILCGAFKNPYVYAVKFCTATADQKKVQPGKEAVIYFTDFTYFDNKIDEIEFFAQHVKIIKAIDYQLNHSDIPKTAQPSNDDLGKTLGLNSASVSIAKSHDADGHFVLDDKRDNLSEKSIYTKAHAAAIDELKNINALITDSMRHHKRGTGMFHLPTTTQAIANEIERVNKNATSPLEALAVIKRLALSQYEEKMNLNKCEPVVKNSFSRLNNFVSRLTQDPAQQKVSSCVLL